MHFLHQQNAEALADVAQEQNETDKSVAYFGNVLQAAYLPGTVSTKAAMTSFSRKFTRNCSKACMWAALRQQEAFLDSVVRSPEKIRIAWERVEFDETKQRLQVRSHADLLACQQVSSWSVMVVCHEVGFICGDGPDEKVHIVDLLRLNKIIVGSCCSGALWDALEGREFQRTRQALDAIRDKAENYFIVWEPDSASPNLKLGPHVLELLRTSSSRSARRTLFSMLPCGLHQISHVIQAICAPLASLSFIRGLYATALLLGSGNFFMRMIFCLIQWIRGRLVVVHEPLGSCNTYTL